MEQITANKVITISRSFNDWIKHLTLPNAIRKYVSTPISRVQRSLIEEIGCFREDPLNGDWDFHIRACLKNEIGVIPEVQQIIIIGFQEIL